MPTGVLHLKEVDTDEITLDGTLSVSGASTLEGATVAHSTLSVGGAATLADANATNVNVSGTLSVAGQTTMGGDIIPDTNDAYDIGSPEFKIRDLYVSNNSIWVGDDMKISNEGGKLKFRKRKTNVVPKAIIDAGANAGHANEQATADAALAHAGLGDLGSMKLQHWFKFMRTLNAAAKLTDIFRENDDDHEESSASDAWKEIADTNKIYTNSAVGVGTSDPDDTLHVKGSFKVESETGFKLIRSSAGGTDPTVIIDTANFGTDETVNDLTGRGDAKYTKLYRVYGRNSEGVGRSWYWGYANDDYSNFSLAFDGGGLPDPDISFTFTTASELHCKKVFAALGGNADTATRLATPRKINGIDFDGSADITIPVGSNGVDGITSSNGKFGLNQTDPKCQLHIRGDDCRLAIADSGQNDADTNAFTCSIAFVDNTWTGEHRYAYNPEAGVGFYLGHMSGSNKEVNMRNLTGPLSFGTRNTNRALFIDDDGNIGLGVSSPTDKLNVKTGSGDEVTNFDVKVGGIIEISRNHSGTPFIHSNMSSGRPRWNLGTAGVTRTQINGGVNQNSYFNTGGNLGVGTTSPSHPLEVNFTADTGLKVKNIGSSHSSVYVDSASGYSYLRFQQSGAEKFWLLSKPTGDLAFRPSGGTERFTFTNGGYLGVGTSSPSSPLDVVVSSEGNYIARIRNNSTGSDQDARMVISCAASSGEPQLLLESSGHKWNMASGSGTSPDLIFQYNASWNGGTRALTIKHGGFVGVGNHDPTAALHVKSSTGMIKCDGDSGRSFDFGDRTYMVNTGGNLVYAWDGYPGIVRDQSNNGEFRIHGRGGTNLGVKCDGGFSSFTGDHDIFRPFSEQDVGKIVYATGEYLTEIKDEKVNGVVKNYLSVMDSCPDVRLCNKAKDKRVCGVFSLIHTKTHKKMISREEYEKLTNEEKYGYSEIEDEEGVVQFCTDECCDDFSKGSYNAVGEGGIWVCNANGEIENGDYITSSDVPGYGQKQDDDLLHNYSVAKATTDADFVKRVIPTQQIDRDECGYMYDEEGNPELVPSIDSRGYTMTHEAKPIRYVDGNGVEIAKHEYDVLIRDDKPAFIAQFIGCTYHCG